MAEQDGSLQNPYDEQYYEHYHSASGVPYERAEPWLTFFGSMADSIVRQLAPHTVLDVGCAKGFLVEALRDRGVPAFGLDISPYAISQVREDMRLYCWVGSALDPFPQRYDLVVCVEVLEHLSRPDAESAVANLCRYADDILFSSTPDDFTEPTHMNVQPVEYWAELFARRDFYRDVDFDATFIAPHAARFRKTPGPVFAVIKAYERRLWAHSQEGQDQGRVNLALIEDKRQLEMQLTVAAQKVEALASQLSESLQQLQGVEAKIRERDGNIERLQLSVKEQDGQIACLQLSMQEKDGQIGLLSAELQEVQSSLGFQLLCGYSRAKKRWLPPGSKARTAYDVVVRGLKVGASQGFMVVLERAVAGLRRRVRFATPTMPSTVDDFAETATRTHAWAGRVLMISGSNGDMERYRCDHTREQLKLSGIPCDIRRHTDSALPDLVTNYDIVILHRTPCSKSIEEIARRARAHRAIVLFDIDDLVFEPEVVERIDALRLMDEAQRALYINGMQMYRRTLETCDAALVTTDSLAQAVAKAGRPAWVHRNALSLELIKISDEAVRTAERHTDRVILGYASGTRTHNRDFQEVQVALQQILEAYPQVELWIIGYLDLDEVWTKWTNRVKCLAFMPWRELPRVLAQLDVNLAPLELDNPFCEAKSELKYLEAAAVGVPTVASRAGAFKFAIRQGENGLLAENSEEWFQALEQMITNPGRRVTMGARARADVLQRYHPVTRSAELQTTLVRIIGGLQAVAPDGAPHLMASEPVSEQSKQPMIFKEHQLAHALLDGLAGLEIGAAAHNPFGLRTHNVASPEGYDFYADHQRRKMGVQPAPVDVWASADNIPVAGRSADFIITSHVVEHLPDLIAAFIEWDRIIRDGGYAFMIVPHRGALPEDAGRALTRLEHFVEDYHRGMTCTRPVARAVWRLFYRFDGWLLGKAHTAMDRPWAGSLYRSLRLNLYRKLGPFQLLHYSLPWDLHSIESIPGGRMGHYHTFTPDSLLQVVEWMRNHGLCDWRLIAREDIDSKVGNGFTLAFQVRH